jgi:Transglycosylase SLT domain
MIYMLKLIFKKVLSLQPNGMLHRQLSNMKRSELRLAMLLCSLVTSFSIVGTAYADVWGYVDAKGVAHFAAEKVDERYEMYFKGQQSFDTKDGLPAASSKPGGSTDSMPRAATASSATASSATASSAAASRGASKLLAYFDVSPDFKAVRHHMREASAANKIDFELLQALIVTESGFDTNAVSPKGAVGLMQLMPLTAQRYGVQADPKVSIEKKLTDPKVNIKAGSRYLRDLMNMFPGKPELALAAYNAGEGAVQRAGNQIPAYKETQNYVVTVMQIYTYLKPPAAIAQRQLENRQPARVRVEMGGSAGRGNMVPPLTNTSPGAPVLPVAQTP